MRISFVAAFLLLSELVLASTPPAQDKGSSDTGLSQRFVGDWESKLETKPIAPLKQVFVSMDSRKHFKIIRVLEFGGRQGRVEYEGKWRISNGKLLWEPSERRVLEGSQTLTGVQEQRIASVENNVIVLHAADGSKRELIRTPIPSQLPPLLPRGAVELKKAVAIYAPKPDYPLEARARHLTGRGVIMLDVDTASGRVTNARMLQSMGHKILDDAALDAFGNGVSSLVSALQM
jgi:TonB family protein